MSSRRSGTARKSLERSQNNMELLKILEMADLNKSYDKIEHLLNAGASPDITNIIGRGGLANACKRNDKQLWTIFMVYGANPNIKDQLENTVLHIAIETIKDFSFFRDVAVACKLCINHKNCLEDTPLYQAILSDISDEKIKFLLILGANPNIVSGYNDGCLHEAIRRNKYSTVKLLLSYNADINQTLSDDHDTLMSPLSIAIDYQRPEICELLLKLGANVNFKKGHKNAITLLVKGLTHNVAKIRQTFFQWITRDLNGRKYNTHINQHLFFTAEKLYASHKS